jgi:single-strand DNA-binding protein
MSLYTVNKAILVGRLGSDAEGKFTQNGNHVMTLRVATDDGIKQPDGSWKNITDWHTVIVWRREKLEQHLTKGTRVYIEGKNKTREYTDREGVKRYVTEIVADVVIATGKGEGNGNGGGSSPQPQRQPTENQTGGAGDGGYGEITDSDVPF